MIGTKAMVVSPHYLASSAGAKIMQKGGNAFDASIAVSACLAVVYPHMTGLGGDAFWMTFQPGEGKVRGYNGTGRSGHLVTREYFAGRTSIPERGIESILTVPGMVDSWIEIHRQYGRLPFAQLLEPAIEYAERGFPLSSHQYGDSKLNEELLRSFPTTNQIYVPDGRIPNKGERFIQKSLANTLKQLATGGRDAFYKGEIAKKIIAFLKQEGGLLTAEDFANHRGEWVEPLMTEYKGYYVYQMPPNSQGFVGLMTLNILKNFDLNLIEHGSYEYYHLLIEALKKSFKDRNEHLTDPDTYQAPMEKLLSMEYARQLASEIRLDRASSLPAAPMGSDTAYAAVVDEEGNAVSFIQSIYFEFGSGVVAGDTGILMQNRGSYFSLDANHVNRLEPNKRTFHTLMPAMALQGGVPKILYGTQGGEGQPQTQTAIFTRMVDYGMDPQTAINAPRWVWGRTWGAATEELRIEARVGADVLKRLADAGHIVRELEDYHRLTGHANAIMIDEFGFIQGGSDPRSDGAAIGW